MAGHANVLGADARPSFFPVAGGEALLVAPEPRRGLAVRFAARSLSVMQKEGLVCSSASPKVWRLVSDEGAYLDGFDEAPCPLSFVTTGMVSQFMEEILALARRRGIAIDAIELVQDNWYTMQGSALQGTMTGGARDVDLEARIKADADPDSLRALVIDAVAAAPVHGLLRGVKDSLFTLTHNGHPVAPGKARPVAGGPVPDLAADLSGVQPEPGDWSGLIVRGEMSPKTAEATSSHGSSLAEQQDRTLHVRGICTLREDGVKCIEQQLFNPHGSVFRYLCDEHGRAPDAASYIAAGIGFCFMTQLGRYATIARKDLASYRVVEDIHFAPGGASGGTGQEDDPFARQALDMGEQTCFLHALCRTDLKVRVRVVGAG